MIDFSCLLYNFQHVAATVQLGWTPFPPKRKASPCFFYATCPILNWNKLVSAIPPFHNRPWNISGETQFMPESRPRDDRTVSLMLSLLIYWSHFECKYLCLGFTNDHFQDDTRLLRGTFSPDFGTDFLKHFILSHDGLSVVINGFSGGLCVSWNRQFISIARMFCCA